MESIFCFCLHSLHGCHNNFIDPFPELLRQHMMHTGLTYGMGTAATSTNLLFHCTSSQCETFYRNF